MHSKSPAASLRGFSFPGIGWITGAPCFNLESREAMTDQRPLLRAIFDAAVAAAHPDSVLSAHLRPVPKGRVIWLAAGKGAGARAAAARRCQRSPAGAVVGRRLRELDRAGRRRLVRAETTGDAGAVTLGRADRRGHHR